MKRSLAYFPAILIVLLLAGTAVSITATPKTAESISPTSLPFSGGISSISGTVFDAKGNGIPNAKVTLYYAVRVGNDYKAKDPVKKEGVTNPQLTGDGSESPAGLYVFAGIPSGSYMLTAEKGGISISQPIMVIGGTATENLYIQGYIETGATPTPRPPTPTPVPTRMPTPAPSVTQEPPDIGAIFIGVLRVMLMGVIGIQLVASVVIIAMQVGRQR
jgi:hypothetical protein